MNYYAALIQPYNKHGSTHSVPACSRLWGYSEYWADRKTHIFCRADSPHIGWRAPCACSPSPCRAWSPSITTSPGDRGPDQHRPSPVTTTVLDKQKARAPHGCHPLTSRCSASTGDCMRTPSSSAGSWCPSSCSEASVDSEFLLLMISLRELSTAPGPLGGHERRKMTLGRQRADSGVYTQVPCRVSGDTVGSAAPRPPKAVPSGWHRLSTSRTLLLAPEPWCCAKRIQHLCLTPSHPRVQGYG